MTTESVARFALGEERAGALREAEAIAARAPIHLRRLPLSGSGTAGPAPTSAPLDGRLRAHPCLTPDPHLRGGRLHLPVSPACNIECAFCDRGFGKASRVPGAAHRRLSPDAALPVVARALQFCPDLRVVGIAGPGDPLATSHAEATLELVAARFPKLLLCLSTNGLRLAEKAERLARLGLSAVTVTVNGVDAAIVAQIVRRVVDRGRTMTGPDAGALLIARQLAGIRRASELGVVVKINTVLVPGVNDRHLADVAAATRAAGAKAINVIPLIPQGALAAARAPTREEVEEGRRAVGGYLEVLRQCAQCRADACGVPGGRDYGSELFEMRARHTFSHG